MSLMLQGLFYREGIRIVGIDRIIAEADITKATSGPKKDLDLANMKRRHALVMKGFSQVLAQSPHARDHLAEISTGLTSRPSTSSFAAVL